MPQINPMTTHRTRPKSSATRPRKKTHSHDLLLGQKWQQPHHPLRDLELVFTAALSSGYMKSVPKTIQMIGPISGDTSIDATTTTEESIARPAPASAPAAMIISV